MTKPIAAFASADLFHLRRLTCASCLRAPIVVQAAPQEEASPLDGKVSYSNPEQTLNEGSSVPHGTPIGRPPADEARANTSKPAKPHTYEKDKDDPYANVGRNDPCPCGSWQEVQEMPRRQSLTDDGAA